jgi:hypothetical protein
MPRAAIRFVQSTVSYSAQISLMSAGSKEAIRECERHPCLSTDGYGSKAVQLVGEKAVEAEQLWYYLNRSRQVGPYSRSELHSLLAKEVILPTTLVWTQGSGGWRTLRELPDEPIVETHKPRQNWIVVALGISVFFSGISIVANVPTGTGSRNVFANGSTAVNTQGLLDNSRVRKQIQISEIAIADFSTQNDPGVNWSTSSPSSTGFMFNVVRPSLPSQASVAWPSEGQLVQEFWRSMAYSDIIDRYEFYLRNYPSGTFADIAIARNKELRMPIKQASVNKGEGWIPKKRAGTNSSRTPKPKKSARITAVKTSTPKTEGRCWSRNIEQCRERCREGEARACQSLKRLGG